MSAFVGVLAQYGQTVTLKNTQGTQTVRAFIQPEVSRGETVPGTQTAIGWVDDRLWRYIGTAEVQTGDMIVWQETAYRVRSSRAYCLGDAVHHWQASLEQEREAAQ